MNVEYVFDNVCSPFSGTFNASFPSFKSDENLRVQLLSFLGSQNVNLQRIETIYYKQEEEEAWEELDSKTLALPLSKIKLRILMKDCCYRKQEELEREIKALQKELEDLKYILLNLSSISLKKDSSISDMGELTKPSDLFHAVSMPIIPLQSASSSPGRKNADIEYLYAVPIVKKSKNNVMALSNPIDAQREIESITEEIEQDSKDLFMRINVGTLDNLRKAIAAGPKVVHISCHGGYEIVEGKPKLFLYLESNELNGVMEKYDVDTILQWFAAEIMDSNSIRPRLVFLSSCYSQAFGEIIKKAGVPNVIAVHYETQVADKAATRFAKIFYHYLMRGNTVKESFQFAKEDGEIQNRNLRLCCCTHNHLETCGWLDRLIENKDKWHAFHEPDCSCELGGNIHYKSCSWVNRMYAYDYIAKPLKDNPRKVRVCCCNPDLPHNEEEKFILISQSDEIANEKIFEEIPEGLPSIKRVFDPENLPSIEEQLVGRNVPLHRLVCLLISTHWQHKIIALNGPKGVGINFLVKTAAKYVIERGFFSNGYTKLELPSTTWLLSKLNSGLLPAPFKEARDLEELNERLRSVKKLVCLKCGDIIETNPLELIQCLLHITEGNNSIKFVIMGRDEIKDENVVNLRLEEDLDPLSAYSIIKGSYPDWSCSYREFETTELKDILTTPWIAKKAAYMLKHDSIDEVFAKLSSELLLDRESPELPHPDLTTSVQDLVNSLNEKAETLSPIFVLSQLPSVVLESDLQNMLDLNWPKWKIKAQNHISDKSEAETLIFCIRDEEIKENKIRLTDIIYKYVNKYLLDSSNHLRYQILCLGKLASQVRKLTQSFNLYHYKCVTHNEFTGILDEGLWVSREMQGMMVSIKKLPCLPIRRFQIQIDNFLYYIDSHLLETIFNQIEGIEVDLPQLINNIRELTLCTFTLLFLQNRPVDAIKVADQIQCFAQSQNTQLRYVPYPSIRRKFSSLMGLMKIIKGGMCLKNCKLVNIKDALRIAEDAEKLFNESENSLGIAESLFLEALLLSADPGQARYATTAFNEAKKHFISRECRLGIARVNIGQAVHMLSELKAGEDITPIDVLLDDALEILNNKMYYDNMVAEVFYLKAKACQLNNGAEMFKKMNEYLNNAIEKAHCVNNNVLLAKCEDLKSYSCLYLMQNYPLLSFLKAFPLVAKRGEYLEALDPLVRKQNFFRPILKGHFETAQAAIKVHFETLSRESLVTAIQSGSVILHLTSEHSEPGTLSMETKMGELDQISLVDLKSLIGKQIQSSQVKCALIGIAEGIEITEMLVELGVPHIVYFKFTALSKIEGQEYISVSRLKTSLIQTFSTDFYKFLLNGDTVLVAVEKANESLRDAFKKKLNSLGLITPIEVEPDFGAILYPQDPNNESGKHDQELFSNLKKGKYIETSKKRGVTEIEKERESLVGRQREMYKIFSLLQQNKCVNLYGNPGVGKTKIARDVAYMLNSRSFFLSGIFYRNDMKKIYNQNSFLVYKNDEIEKREGEVLFVVDNLKLSFWKIANNFFKSLREREKYIFLFISEEPLSPISGFEITKIRLKPFAEDKISLTYVMTHLEQNKFMVSYQQHSGKRLSPLELSDSIKHSLGFNQAKGNPKLLQIFAERILNYADISQINLLKESSVEFRLRRFIRPTVEKSQSKHFQEEYKAKLGNIIVRKKTSIGSRAEALEETKRGSVYKPSQKDQCDDILLVNMRYHYGKSNSKRVDTILDSYKEEESEFQDNCQPPSYNPEPDEDRTTRLEMHLLEKKSNIKGVRSSHDIFGKNQEEIPQINIISSPDLIVSTSQEKAESRNNSQEKAPAKFSLNHVKRQVYPKKGSRKRKSKALYRPKVIKKRQKRLSFWF